MDPRALTCKEPLVVAAPCRQGFVPLSLKERKTRGHIHEGNDVDRRCFDDAQGQPVPEVNYPKPVKMNGTAKVPPQTPGLDATGPVPNKPETETVPVEQLQELRKMGQPVNPPMPAVQFVPVPIATAPTTTPGNAGPSGNSGNAATPASLQGTTGK